MKILAIDPGTNESGYVLMDGLKIIDKGNIGNDSLRTRMFLGFDCEHVIIEKMENQGMPVGSEVLDTCIWIGRFVERAALMSKSWELITRKTVRLHLCGSSRAKDSNIRQALLDRYGKEVTKGVVRHAWQALALATTYLDRPHSADGS